MAIAFGYNEAAVVVYLRQIFHPTGFKFPLEGFLLADSSQSLLMVEVGREAATLVLILSGCLLAGHNCRQRGAYFMTIFAVWDIFYYVWLKVLIGWPASIMDWDVLFLIPVPWAGPILAPIIVSGSMLVFAGLILYRDREGRPIRAGSGDWLGFIAAGVVVIVSFCMPGTHISQPDYAAHFSWSFFLAGLFAAIVIFIKCLSSQSNSGEETGITSDE
jgi:hypothetical protein